MKLDGETCRRIVRLSGDGRTVRDIMVITRLPEPAIRAVLENERQRRLSHPPPPPPPDLSAPAPPPLPRPASTRAPKPADGEGGYRNGPRPRPDRPEPPRAAPAAPVLPGVDLGEIRAAVAVLRRALVRSRESLDAAESALQELYIACPRDPAKPPTSAKATERPKRQLSEEERDRRRAALAKARAVKAARRAEAQAAMS